MAAGLGFKTFTTGEVLTAGDVNGYLMQGVLVFASNAARDAAITAPAEGQFAFTKDTNGLWFYDGAAWVASGATGDIEGVTAGIGISGGGTSGTVTVTNSMATAIDAKGDLVAGTGADTFARLAVGANDTILVADSSTATGLKWAAPAGGGKVLQVVEGTTTSYTTSSTATFIDTNLTATITPSASTSKVLVIVAQSGCGHDANNGGVFFNLLRSSTVIANVADGIYGFASVNVQGRRGYTLAITCLDSPSTTSATTYKTQFKNDGAGFSVVQDYLSTETTRSSIILMEIGA